jgi:ATP phosphoribosyltransferase regulatory subunit
LNIDIPIGVRAYNRRETRELEFIKKTIEDTFQKWCYEKITLPIFEYFEVHKKAFGEDIENKVFKLIDRSSGEILALRADFTSQIARYIASLKRKIYPKRYYYVGRVFRYYPPKQNNLWENFQIGIELIGVPKLEAEAETIMVAIQSLKRLGLTNYQIDINNVKIYEVLKEILDLDEEEYKQFLNYIKQREIYNLKDFLNQREISKEIKEFILYVSYKLLTIDELRNLKSIIKNEKILQVLEELEHIYQILEEYELSDNVLFDLSAIRLFSYYTGIIFEIFLKDFRKLIGRGGRYDRLLEQYNGKIPATGFAFNLLNIWEYMQEKNLLKVDPKKDFYIIDTTDDKKTAYKLAKFLRELGYNVARDIINRDWEKSLNIALEENFKYVIVIKEENNKEIAYVYDKNKTIILKMEVDEILNKKINILKI